MQFELTESQNILKASANDWFAANAWSSVEPSGIAAANEGPDRWQAFAAMGWLGLAFSEADGGSGGGPMEAGVLMRVFGAHLENSPYVASIVIACGLLDRLGAEGQQRRLLSEVAVGRARLALAHSEPGSSWPWSSRRLSAKRSNGVWRLSGVKQLVEDAHLATHWLVSARCDDDRERVFLVEQSSAVEQLRYRTLQGGQACDLHFDHLPLPFGAVLGEDDASHEAALSDALATGLIAQCWAACGAMDMLLLQTANYVKQRRQFGKSLSEFQAVQHKLAEIAVECSEAGASCELSSMRAACAGEDLRALAAAVKTRVGRAADVVGKHAVQLHGAMGVCDELPVASAFRWLEAFQAQFGRGALHAAWLGQRLADSRRHAGSALLEHQS